MNNIKYLLERSRKTELFFHFYAMRSGCRGMCFHRWVFRYFGCNKLCW